jgi:hypothetical protein
LQPVDYLGKLSRVGTNQQPEQRVEQMSEERNATRRQEIIKELSAMPVGNCGTKFGWLVWRRGLDCFTIGGYSVNIADAGKSLATTVNVLARDAG